MNIKNQPTANDLKPCSYFIPNSDGDFCINCFRSMMSHLKQPTSEEINRLSLLRKAQARTLLRLRNHPREIEEGGRAIAEISLLRFKRVREGLVNKIKGEKKAREVQRELKRWISEA